MRRIAVVGLGTVGLPVAIALARRHPGVVGYDVDVERVARLAGGLDRTGQVTREDLESVELRLTSDPAELAPADLYVLTVPTPVDARRTPDLGPLREAARTVGRVLSRGDVVVLESTVYPGVTEGVLGPLLAEVSGLEQGRDFALAYSPERIDPGDREHSFERVVKVIAAQDEETLRVVADVYRPAVPAGLHPAPSIRVAEAAKVVENVQRDLNVALVNELARIFERLGIDTRDVLAAAGTKWNFHPYVPGLVGGHCIGVDPYYLAAVAREAGVEPEVLLAGRRTNDGMARNVAERTITSLARAGIGAPGARIAVLGSTYKEDVPDARMSLVPEVVRVLREHGAEVLVHDPIVDPDDARAHQGLELAPREALTGLSAVVLAVPHRGLAELALELAGERGVRVLADVKAAVDRRALRPDVLYWRL